MKSIRVYADTSVFGGVFDREYRSASISFFDQVKSRLINLYTSAIVREEILYAPAQVKKLFSELIEYMEIIDISEPALKLRDAYLKAKIVPRKFSNDALHVAIASVSSCPIVVSWNFKHIVHYEKIALYNSMNILEGYPQISIYSPLEVIKYE
jgi:predicted nucleic acid-binding protein